MDAGVAEVAFSVKEDDGTGVGGVEEGGDGEFGVLVLLLLTLFRDEAKESKGWRRRCQ